MIVAPVEGIHFRDPRTMLPIPEHGVSVMGHEPWAVRGIAQKDLQEISQEKATAILAQKANADAEAAAEAKSHAADVHEEQAP